MMGHVVCALLAVVLIGGPALVTLWAMGQQAPSGRRGGER